MKTHTQLRSVLCLSATALLFAQGAIAQPPDPEYPQVNPSPWYQVAPDWPDRPDEVDWTAVPGVTIDATGNVWLFTRTDPAVQVYSPEGTYLFGWGDRPGAHHLAIDDEGFIWTTDVRRHIVQKHEVDGTVVMTLGTDGEAGADESHFFKPTDVDFASNGDIFVSDGYGNNRVVHFDKNGNFIKAWGDLGVDGGQFSCPHSLAIDSKDRIYIGDRNNARVQIFNMDGKLLDTWDHILIPWGIHITDKDDVWVCGSAVMAWEQQPEGAPTFLGVPPRDQLAVRFNTSGKVLELHTFPKGKDGEEQPGELNWVHCIELDTAGNLFLGDIIGKRLHKFIRKPGG